MTASVQPDLMLRELLREDISLAEYCERAVRYISESDDRYDWVGIYLASGDTLRLPSSYYVGPPTQHTEIPFTEGVCGACARSRETIIVDDVNEDPRYLECSPDTRSEIVVPIMHDETLYGLLDLDSDTPAAFDETDREVLEAAADHIAERFRREKEKNA